MATIRITEPILAGVLANPAQALAILREELNQGLFQLVNEGADTAKLLAPVNLGILRSSITAEVLAPAPGVLAHGVLFTGPQSIAYARPVEFGSRPHWAPIAPLKHWARRVLGDERLGYAVQRAIARRGTRAQPYFGPAVDEMRRDARGVLRESLDRATTRMEQL